MEIILKRDVVNLVYQNDIVTNKSGYSRNCQSPGKAIASPSAKKMLAEELKQRAPQTPENQERC